MTTPYGNDPYGSGSPSDPFAKPYAGPPETSEPTYPTAAYPGQPVPYGQAPVAPYGQPMQPAYGGYGGGYQPGPPPGGTGGSRPGILLGSSVLAFIGGALLILAGLILLLGASIVNDISDAVDEDGTGATAELAFDGLVNLVAAGLLIAGGAMQGSGPKGRTLLTVGAVMTIGAGIYWLIRAGGASTTVMVFFEIVFVTPVLLALILAWQKSVSNYYRSLVNRPPGY